jgi:hypothetical protein
MAVRIVSAMFWGQGGAHSAHAGGEGSPPECALRA